MQPTFPEVVQLVSVFGSIHWEFEPVTSTTNKIFVRRVISATGTQTEEEEDEATEVELDELDDTEEELEEELNEELDEVTELEVDEDELTAELELEELEEPGLVTTAWLVFLVETGVKLDSEQATKLPKMQKTTILLIFLDADFVVDTFDSIILPPGLWSFSDKLSWTLGLAKKEKSLK